MSGEMGFRILGPILVAATTLVGCAEELGPEPMPTASINGRVHVRGRPVGGGWIEFRPVGETVGLQRSARLLADGTFRADRVAVGLLAIRVVHPPFPLPCGRLFERISVVRRVVERSGNGPIDIDLDREARRHCPERPTQ